MNIALVVLDTLRKDAFDEHFGWLPGNRFENAWSTSHWTVPAHASLFAGKYGSELGVHGKNKHLDCPEKTIAELLVAAGWNTHAYSCNIHVSHWFGFDRGFNQFEGTELGDNVGFNWAEFVFAHRHEGTERYFKLLREIARSDAPTFSTLKQGARIKLEDLGLIGSGETDSGAREVLQFVKSTSWDDDGEFLFLNLMEAHKPYEAPEEYRTVDPVTVDGPKATLTGDPGVDPDHLRSAYEDCVCYLSDVYADIYDTLERDFDVIITLSDHGEAFGEYDGWEHFSGLWPEVTHVPLVVSTPRDHVPSPESTDNPVSLFDIFQTICDYTDIDPPEVARGTSLFDAGDEHHLIETHGMLAKAHDRLEHQGFDAGSLDALDVTLHAIAGSGYSFENFDEEIVDWNSGVDNAEKLIEEFVDELDIREVDNQDGVPEHIEERMKHLGYA